MEKIIALDIEQYNQILENNLKLSLLIEALKNGARLRYSDEVCFDNAEQAIRIVFPEFCRELEEKLKEEEENGND